MRGSCSKKAHERAHTITGASNLQQAAAAAEVWVESRGAPPGRQRHKAAELTGLGALVRNVTAHEELLLRAVVAYL